MKPWQQVLREHDPIEPLSADEAASIRRAVMVEARAASGVGEKTRLAPVFALGSALMLAVIVGAFIARAQPAADPANVSAPGDMRQLQFATPGGTRIIWEFNPNFSLRETHP